MQAATPQLRNRRRTREQGNSIMQAERARSPRFAFELSEETERNFLRRPDPEHDRPSRGHQPGENGRPIQSRLTHL